MVIAYHSAIIYSTLAAAPSGPLERAFDSTVRLAKYGDLGVPFFFVISGYCIAAAAEGVRRRGRSVGNYFFRRFRRIYPPFWIVVGASVVFFVLVDVVLSPRLLSAAPWVQPRPWWYSGWQWIGNLTLTETWREHVIGGPRGHFPGQAWTLCYEEQFYAVVGLLLWLGRSRFFQGVLLVTAATLVVCNATSRLGWNVKGFFFDGSWLTFAAGVLVYWAIVDSTSRHAKTLAFALLLVAAVAVGSLPVPGGTAAFLFAGILLVLHPLDARMASSRWTRPLMYCGQMCYSLYLVHQLLVKAVTQSLWNAGFQSAVSTLLVAMPLSAMVSIVVGRICFVTVERRFLNTSPSDRRAVGSMPWHETGTVAPRRSLA